MFFFFFLINKKLLKIEFIERIETCLALHENMLVRPAVSYLQSLELHQLKENLSLEMVASQAYLHVPRDRFHVESLLLLRVRATLDGSLRNFRHPRTRLDTAVPAAAVPSLLRSSRSDASESLRTRVAIVLRSQSSFNLEPTNHISKYIFKGIFDFFDFLFKPICKKSK